jgi:probable rRNA maturation factor
MTRRDDPGVTPNPDNRSRIAHEIDVEIACRSGAVPDEAWLAGCVALALKGHPDAVSVAVRIVDADEIRSCNRRYRNRDRTTNVLSFPAASPAPLGVVPLGDILVCAPVVAEEAVERGISRGGPTGRTC